MDQGLGAYMNEHFINVKWDAESVKYGRLSAEYGVSVFPTLLFLDHEGLLYKRKVGLQDKQSLMKDAQDLIKYLETDFETLTQEILSKNNVDEIKAFLSNNIGMEFPGKSSLFDRFLELKQVKTNWDETAYDILIDNMYNEYHLEAVIENIPNYDRADIEQRRKRVSYFSKIKAEINRGIKKSIKSGKEESFEKYLDLNFSFSEKVNARTKGSIAKQENENHRFEFYKTNVKHEEYVKHAANFLTPLMDNSAIEKLKASDTRARQTINKTEAVRNTTLAASAKRQVYERQSQAYKLSHQINNISQDFLKFFPSDKAKLETALNYALLSNKYFDTPESRYTIAAILNSLEKKDEALSHVDAGLSSELLEWRIKSRLDSLKKKLN